MFADRRKGFATIATNILLYEKGEVLEILQQWIVSFFFCPLILYEWTTFSWHCTFPLRSLHVYKTYIIILWAYLYYNTLCYIILHIYKLKPWLAAISIVIVLSAQRCKYLNTTNNSLCFQWINKIMQTRIFITLSVSNSSWIENRTD